MPIYEYECGDCGNFTEMRRIVDCNTVQMCPTCGFQARRVIGTVMLSIMSSKQRSVHVTNERSVHAPTSCHQNGHCDERKVGHSKTSANSEFIKTFPSKRPWMISH